MFEDKLDFEFGENNTLFAGRFCQYYPDVPSKTQEEEILDATIFVTESRKKVLADMFETMQSDFKVSGKKSKILLDGSEGRGKTYTLLLLAHLLRKSSKKVFLVYFQNSKEINDFGWKEICKQFEFALNENEKEKVRKIEKAKGDDIKRDGLNEILEEYKEKGYLTILMIDQLNFLDEESQSIVSKLFKMVWDVELCSQSANNEPKKTFIKDSKPILCPELMNQKEIQALIEDYLHKSNNDFEFDANDFENFIQYTGVVPQEVIRLIKSEGDSMDEKLENYINKRSEELLTNHKKFRNSIMGDLDKNDLNIAAFYTDSDIPVFLKSEPLVDRQIQITIKKERDKKMFYSFSSAFPLCKSILKESIVGSLYLDLNFFEERLKELRTNLKKLDLDERMRGIVYEELIHATIQDLQKRNQPWTFKFYSQNKLRKKYLKDRIFGEVHIDRCISFKNDEELMSYIEDFDDKNLTCYLIPSISNYKGYDCFLFIHKSQLSSIKFDFDQNAHLLIGIQIKKNFNLVCDEQLDIQQKYEEKKEKLKNMVQDLTDIQWVFMLVCQNEKSNSEWELIKGEEEEEILFLFTDENGNEKIFKV